MQPMQKQRLDPVELARQAVSLVIPAYYNVPYCLTRINVYSKMNSMYGSQNEKMKNWETNADGYTTEEMEAFKQAYLAE